MRDNPRDLMQLRAAVARAARASRREPMSVDLARLERSARASYLTARAEHLIALADADQTAAKDLVG